MTVKQLYEYIKGGIERDNGSTSFGDQEIVIKLDYPTYGGSVVETITGLRFGFDWDDGRAFLTSKNKLKLSDHDNIQNIQEK